MVVYKLLRAASKLVAFAASSRAAAASGVSLVGSAGAGAGCFSGASTLMVGKATGVCAKLAPPRHQNNARAQLLRRSTRPIGLDPKIGLRPQRRLASICWEGTPRAGGVSGATLRSARSCGRGEALSSKAGAAASGGAAAVIFVPLRRANSIVAAYPKSPDY
jgi:hypothetical protein